MNINKVIIKQPSSQGELDEYYKTRWEILRKPLGGDLKSATDDLEDESYHLIALINKKIIGVGRIHTVNNVQCQIRYMAVVKKYQKFNIGTMILNTLELYAKKKNKKYIILHARETALNFYIKNRYKVIDKSHLLLGKIQHYQMKKKINYEFTI